MRFVSQSVITGFVNALAILIFLAQLPELMGVSWVVYLLTAAGLAIIYLFPYITRTVPSPLVCIVSLTGIASLLDLDIRTVGSLGALPDRLPVFAWPAVPTRLPNDPHHPALLRDPCGRRPSGVDDDGLHRGRSHRHRQQ